MAPRILIISIAMDADNSFYVKFIATEEPIFFGYSISVFAMVNGVKSKIFCFLFFFEQIVLFALHCACRAENKNCVKCYGHRACFEIPRSPRVIITYHLYLRF